MPATHTNYFFVSSECYLQTASRIAVPLLLFYHFPSKYFASSWNFPKRGLLTGGPIPLTRGISHHPLAELVYHKGILWDGHLSHNVPTSFPVLPLLRCSRTAAQRYDFLLIIAAFLQCELFFALLSEYKGSAALIVSFNWAVPSFPDCYD